MLDSIRRAANGFCEGVSRHTELQGYRYHRGCVRQHCIELATVLAAVQEQLARLSVAAVETPDGSCLWGASEIRAAAADGRSNYSLTPDQRDSALAKLDWMKTDASKRRRDLGIESLYRERERWKARFWELRERVLDTPATTLGGILAKLRGFYHDDEIAAIRDGDYDEDLPAEWAVSIYRDLERLAGGALS